MIKLGNGKDRAGHYRPSQDSVFLFGALPEVRIVV
jgi:hypothetical protein